MNTNEIKTAYQELIRATNTLYAATVSVNKAAIVLAEREAHVAASLNLKADGLPDNETTRKAAIANASKTERATLQAARDKQAEAQNLKDVAELRVQLQRELLILKLMELSNSEELRARQAFDHSTF
jgi:hypothetical protein